MSVYIVNQLHPINLSFQHVHICIENAIFLNCLIEIINWIKEQKDDVHYHCMIYRSAYSFQYTIY